MIIACYRDKINYTGVKNAGQPLGTGWPCFLFFILMVFCFGASAQKNKTDSVIHFKVRYNNGDYRFIPADGYLFLRSRNKIRIINSKNKNFTVKLVGGSIKCITGDSIFEIDNLLKPGNVLLSIYEKDGKGKDKLVLNKPFTVIPYPVARFAGVACDSALSPLKMATGCFTIHYPSLKMKVPVNSFKMEFYENKKFILDSSASNRLSKKMLKYVEKLKPGSVIYLSDIKYKDPNGNEQTEPIYRVFIVKDEQVLKMGVD